MDSGERRATERNAPPEERRRWTPPAIEWEEDFLPYAFSTCGKMPGQGGPCTTHRSS